jgi:protein phosphatase 2C family protein 2/3
MSDGPVKGFAANSHCGIKRVQNEDRVSVSISSLNLKSATSQFGSKNRTGSFSLFSVFDGHGGTRVADFLKERFHHAMATKIETGGLSSKDLKSVFHSIDEEVIQMATAAKDFQSGSCALSLLVLEESLILMNVGDCRCVASQSNGSVLRALSTEHKPELIGEFSRIIESDGRIERESVNIATKLSEFHFATKFSHVRAINKLKKVSPDKFFSPWRILPGGLSVSRSLGDASSKLPEFGGKSGTVIAEPDILDFETENFDFLVLACDLTSRRRIRSAQYRGCAPNGLGNNHSDAFGGFCNPPTGGGSPGRVRQQYPQACASGRFGGQRIGSVGQLPPP